MPDFCPEGTQPGGKKAAFLLHTRTGIVKVIAIVIVTVIAAVIVMGTVTVMVRVTVIIVTIIMLLVLFRMAALAQKPAIDSAVHQDRDNAYAASSLTHESLIVETPPNVVIFHHDVEALAGSPQL
jgi:ribose/xylose/arabinose/galactoside ABC-type transport system permease subunit